MKSKHSVSMLWVDGQFGHFELLCASSWVAAGFDLTVFSYNPELTIPDGAILRSAGEIVGFEKVFRNSDRPGTYAGFSNLFRYALLSQRDTIWVDSDVLATGRAFPRSDYLFGRESRKWINGAVLAVPPNSDVLRFWLETAEASQGTDVVLGQLGPKLITRGVSLHGLEDRVSARQVFYPISFRTLWTLFDPRRRRWVDKIVSNSVTVHLWNEAFRETPVKKSRPPEGSYLDLSFKRFGIDTSHLPELDLAWLRHSWKRKLDPAPWESGFLESRLGRFLSS